MGLPQILSLWRYRRRKIKEVLNVAIARFQFQLLMLCNPKMLLSNRKFSRSYMYKENKKNWKVSPCLPPAWLSKRSRKCHLGASALALPSMNVNNPTKFRRQSISINNIGLFVGRKMGVEVNGNAITRYCSLYNIH